jgi:hypothetical protein
VTQEKGQGGSDKERAKERPANKAQENAPAATETADKNAGKSKAAKQADDAVGKAGEQKQGGPQGKKMEKAATDAVEQGKGKGKGKGKGQEKQAQAFQKQLQHEQAKHMERQARLARIRELAVKKGDAEMIARVDNDRQGSRCLRPQTESLKDSRAPRRMVGIAPPATVGSNAAAEQKARASKLSERAKEGGRHRKRRRSSEDAG